MLYILGFLIAFYVLIFLITSPIRKKKNAKNQEIMAESGEKLEEVPIKTLKINGGNSYIDVNYVLFYSTSLGIQKYDIKNVKSLKIISQRIRGNRTYYLCLEDENGNGVGKGLYYPSLKQAEKMQMFIQKYIDKIASEK